MALKSSIGAELLAINVRNIEFKALEALMTFKSS